MYNYQLVLVKNCNTVIILLIQGVIELYFFQREKISVNSWRGQEYTA